MKRHTELVLIVVAGMMMSGPNITCDHRMSGRCDGSFQCLIGQVARQCWLFRFVHRNPLQSHSGLLLEVGAHHLNQLIGALTTFGVVSGGKKVPFDVILYHLRH